MSPQHPLYSPNIKMKAPPLTTKYLSRVPRCSSNISCILTSQSELATTTFGSVLNALDTDFDGFLIYEEHSPIVFPKQIYDEPSMNSSNIVELPGTTPVSDTDTSPALTHPFSSASAPTATVPVMQAPDSGGM